MQATARPIPLQAPSLPAKPGPQPLDPRCLSQVSGGGGGKVGAVGTNGWSWA